MLNETRQVRLNTAGPWLLDLQSRAAARLGDAETASTANHEATERRERVVPDDLDQLGGLFTYAPEKQLYYEVEPQRESCHWCVPSRHRGRAAHRGRVAPCAKALALVGSLRCVRRAPSV
ncbi:hypothetical protein [Streptomyces sp. SID4917]|uniref:hypothetical protein n=1 Tax=Streptomyces sp. SID4917 TaxID=2690269 RepID=UPI001F322B44|nr:hypothetical protein [Streptomyces sp. SID4917]